MNAPNNPPNATPRTDREVYRTGQNDVGFEVVNPSLCRQIERENAALLALLGRAADALRGMVGYMQLVAPHHPDLPVDNHRVLECMSCAKAVDAALHHEGHQPQNGDRVE